MEKRLKYLIWCLVVWFWLLFNQSFWLDVELTSLSWDFNYLVEFPINASICTYYSCDPLYNYRSYRISYNDWSVTNISQPYYMVSDCWTSDCPTKIFNNTIFWYQPYSSSSYHYTARNIKPYNTIIPYSYRSLNQLEFVLSKSWYYWNAFVCVDCLNTNITTNPKFALWHQIIVWGYDLITDIDYLRLLYDTWIDVDLLDFVVYDTTWNSFNNPKFVWHEYFNHFWSRTNYWRISDTRWYVYSRFWLYWYWYSQVYKTSNSNTWQVARGDINFRTYFDSIITPLQEMYNDPTKWILIESDLSWYYFDWVLVLPSNSYYSWSDPLQYLIAKDPNNLSQILYEVYSCANSDVNVLFSWSDWCYKIDAWYLTYNNSKFLMNFPNYWIDININDSDYPFLSDITQFRWQVIAKWLNQIQIWSHTYWLETDYNVSIQDWLNSFNPEATADYYKKCITDSSFYEENKSFCDVFASALNTWLPTEIPWTYDQYVVVSYDENWNPIYWITIQDDFISQKSWYEWQIDWSWNWYLGCVSDSCNPYYNSWVDVWYSSLTEWFSDFFENWMFFACPFPYDHVKTFQLWSDLMAQIWNKILFPINCMIAWYQEWKLFNILWSWWQVLDSRLLSSDDYDNLYKLFDVILSLWILFFIFKVYNLIK